MELTPILSVDQLMVQDPVIVAPSQTVREVVRLMNERQIGAALVGEGRRLVGIFTERDMLRHAATAPLGWLQQPVADWMTLDPWTIGLSASWDQAISLMETLHVRHVPVTEDGVIVGILSQRDLVARHGEYLARVVEERTRELRQANERLRDRDRELRLHMAVAGKLQTRLLPKSPPDWPEIHWAAHYAPLDALGGDYFDFAQPDHRHLGILIADASGHSIPAAMVAIMARMAFAAIGREMIRPAEALAAMNRQLHGLTEEHFVTAFYGVIDRETRTLTYSNAGHPVPLYYGRKAGACQPLNLHGLMLGIEPEMQYDEKQLLLDPGDKLLFYTDGVSDCTGASGAPFFGALRVEQHLLENADQSAATIVRRLADRLTAYRGDYPARDDATVLVADVRGCLAEPCD